MGRPRKSPDEEAETEVEETEAEEPAGADIPGGPQAPAAEEAPEVEENEVVLDKGTPSGAALDKVGPPPEDASDEELNEHAAAYGAAKAKVRWG